MTDIKIISGDKTEAVGLDQLLKEETLRERAKSARELFNRIQDEFNELGDIKDGLSFLDLKNDLLLSYMIDVCNIVLIKLRQKGSISGHLSVERCVEYRVTLEKIKGIDQKLAYQLNQLITNPDRQDEERVQVENLDIDICEERRISQTPEKDEDDDVIEDGVYKPPKLRSVAYTDDRRKKDDFYQDDDVRDMMIEESRDTDEMDRIEFEESNYTRLRPKKTSRKKQMNKPYSRRCIRSRRF